MAPYKRKNKKTRTPKRKIPTQSRSANRTLSEYILSISEIGALHSLSDAVKIFHGFDKMEFVVENSPDVVENAETRKETAKIIRKLKIARAGKPTIRRKRGGLHIQVLALKAPIVEAVPTTLIAPILEDTELESPTVEVDETGDSDDEILDSICVTRFVRHEVNNAQGSRMSAETPSPEFQCGICYDWFDTAYQRRVHQWDKYGIRHVRFEEQGQIHSCGGKI
ncbi:hypothetical protein P167DRAFT_574413 [Morchella conica CCBAS932]|uniref:Uncharacterized protein n=1 Tax=Morchella conica CCBAS932 TaxID=1392247 RepID=A0A3N4KPJ1_9PEZI|nr:hypothetical protein P167DRAFT_574413 [Morchella conica CCBAS932]